MRITGYSVSRGRLSKMPGLWGHYEPNILAPLAYLKRPKRLSDRQWEHVLDCVHLVGLDAQIMNTEGNQ